MGYLPVVLAFGLLMLAVERMRPGRQFERVAGWHGRAIALTVTQAAVAIVGHVRVGSMVRRPRRSGDSAAMASWRMR